MRKLRFKDRPTLTVIQLIHILSTMPPDAEVHCLWEGALRSSVETVYLARNGYVVVTDAEDIIYNEDEKPRDLSFILKK